jgi:hypothetical protein
MTRGGPGVKTKFTEELWKKMWDETERVPKADLFYTKSYRRDRQLYVPEVGQFFHRKEDDLIVEIMWVSDSGIAVVQNARTKEWYSSFVMEFSTRQVEYQKDQWVDVHMCWTRIQKAEAKLARRAYRLDRLRSFFDAWFPTKDLRNR